MIQVNNLRKAFADVTAVGGVSVETGILLTSGAVCFILGIKNLARMENK